LITGACLGIAYALQTIPQLRNTLHIRFALRNTVPTGITKAIPDTQIIPNARLPFWLRCAHGAGTKLIAEPRTRTGVTVITFPCNERIGTALVCALIKSAHQVIEANLSPT